MVDRILVIRFSSIGDIILTEPVVRALASHFPDARITYLTKTKFLPLLDMFGGIDSRFGWSDDRHDAEYVSTLRQDNFDLIVDLHANLRSAKVRTALGVKSVRARKEWFKRIVSVKLNALAGKPSHALERYFASLKVIGIEIEPTPPVLEVTGESRYWWRDKLSRLTAPSYYVIAAGAAHATKRAPESLWVNLDRTLRHRLGLSPILVGSPAEHDYLANLALRFDEPPVEVVTESDIRHAAAVIESARFTLSNDSGLAHLAAAVGTPIVALFGPTHAILGFAPLGDRADFYCIDESCSPCSLHGDRRCHRSERFCFTKMQIDAIVAKIEALISR